MIWVSKELDHWVETEHPDWVEDTVTICKKVFKKLTPLMFEQLYHNMRNRAQNDTLTEEDVKRFSALEQTINALGLASEFRTPKNDERIDKCTA